MDLEDRLRGNSKSLKEAKPFLNSDCKVHFMNMLTGKIGI